MSRSEPSDAALLAVLAHDPAALEEFYRRHVDGVVRFLARRCEGPEELADAVAQTFLELIQSAERFDARRGDPLAWLFGIAAHCAAAEGRRARRQVAIARRLSGRELLDDDDYERLAGRIDAARVAPELASALAGLREADRRLVELVDVDGLSTAAAAALAGMRPAAARMRLTRARRRLRTALETTTDEGKVAMTQGERT